MNELEFDRLWRDSKPALLRLATKLTRNPDTAADLVQETAFKCWRAFDSFQREASFRTWAMKILCRLNIERWRKERIRPKTWSLEFEVEPGCPIGEVIGADDPNILEVEAEGAYQAMLSDLRERLSDREIRLIVMAVEGIADSQMAELFHVRLGTAKSRLHRAKARARKFLGAA